MEIISFAIVGPRPEPYPKLLEEFWIRPGPMQRPRVLILEDRGDEAFIYGYAADGTFSGDTWYKNASEAKIASQQTYGFHLAGWIQTNQSLQECIQSALKLASQESSWGLYNAWNDELIRHLAKGPVVVQILDQQTGFLTIRIETVILQVQSTLLMKLPQPPLMWGMSVRPRNHLERLGTIVKMGWHFAKQQYFFFVQYNTKRYSKRYGAEDLELAQ